jgi:uncharacterized protein YlxP (DUF503 family)
MVIGILQFDLLIRGAESLKDKRRVVQSVKDRLHREHLVSISEVALQDNIRTARMGLALVSGDERYVAQSLDRITTKLRGLHDAQLGDVTREIVHGQGLESASDDPDQPDPALDAELRRHVEDSLKEITAIANSASNTGGTP